MVKQIDHTFETSNDNIIKGLEPNKQSLSIVNPCLSVSKLSKTQDFSIAQLVNLLFIKEIQDDNMIVKIQDKILCNFEIGINHIEKEILGIFNSSKGLKQKLIKILILKSVYVSLY